YFCPLCSSVLSLFLTHVLSAPDLSTLSLHDALPIFFVNTKTLGVLLALPGLYNQEYRLHHTNCQLKIRRASFSPFFPLSDESLLCDRPYIVALLFPTV